MKWKLLGNFLEESKNNFEKLENMLDYFRKNFWRSIYKHFINSEKILGKLIGDFEEMFTKFWGIEGQ